MSSRVLELMAKHIGRPAQKSASKTPLVFLSHALADKEHARRLMKHLAVYEKDGALCVWHREMVHPGDPTEDLARSKLEEADVIILLLSVDHNEERREDVERALKRAEEGSARVVPVLLRATSGIKTIVGERKVIPAKSVVEYPVQDEAWAEITTEIANIIVPPPGRKKQYALPQTRPDRVAAPAVQPEPDPAPSILHPPHEREPAGGGTTQVHIAGSTGVTFVLGPNARVGATARWPAWVVLAAIVAAVGLVALWSWKGHETSSGAGTASSGTQETSAPPAPSGTPAGASSSPPSPTPTRPPRLDVSRTATSPAPVSFPGTGAGESSQPSSVPATIPALSSTSPSTPTAPPRTAPCKWEPGSADGMTKPCAQPGK